MTSRLGLERPFPGLRPYEAGDHEWFFGRTRQNLALYRLLDLARLIAVVGGSGSGKSSLVRAGLLPLLAKESAGDGGRHWRCLELRPGDAPIARLADALSGGHEAEEHAARLRAARRERIDFTLRSSSFGLIDVVRGLDLTPGTTPLILIDQFEELFRFADLPGSAAVRAGRREEATAFVQLLLEGARAPAPAIRLVLTMRSDFLGDCARFHGLPEAVTGSQFLVPTLTRDQREEAIRGPIRRAGGTIDDDLVERLLNDSSEEQDQLPVLQHALMRTWELGRRADPRELTVDCYKEVGGIAEAISWHADELLREPELAGLQLAVEQVFRALAELDRHGRGIRRPLPFAQLVAETGIPEADVRVVVDRFRRDDCSFLVPPYVAGRPLVARDVVDIGHEALIRRWSRMNREEAGVRAGWLWDEAGDGRSYRGLLTVIDGVGRSQLINSSYVEQPHSWARAARESASRAAAWLVTTVTRGRLGAVVAKVMDSVGLANRPTLPFGQLNSRLRWWRMRQRTNEWAERYEGRLAEVERLFADSRKRSRLIRSVAAALCIAFAGAAVAVLNSWHEAERRADETKAALIWARLDFEDTNDPRTDASVRALWDLATSTAAVRDAFLAQLAQDRYQVDTLADAPDAIARAFGLVVPQAYVARLLSPILNIGRRSGDFGKPQALAQLVQRLGPGLTSDQAQAALDAILDAILTSGGALRTRALASAVQTLSRRLTSDQARAAVGPVLETIRQTRDPYRLGALVQVVRTLGPTNKRTQAALSVVLEAMRETTDPNSLRALTDAVQDLEPSITPELAHDALDLVLDTIHHTISPYQLQALAQAIQTLGKDATVKQTQVVLGQICDAIGRAVQSDLLRALAQAVQSLGPILAPEQAQAAFDQVLNAISRTTDADQLRALVEAAQVLSLKLAPNRARASLGSALSAMEQIADLHSPTSANQVQALAEVVQALGPSPEQSDAALSTVLGAISQTTNPYRLGALTRAVQALGATPQQTLAAVDWVIVSMRETTNPLWLQAMAQVVQTLGPTSEQTRLALDPILDAIPQTVDPFSVQTLAQAVEALAPRLGPEHARAALGHFLDSIHQTTNPYRLQALAQVVRALGPDLRPEQAKDALTPVFAAIRHTRDPDQLRALAEAVQTLGPMLASDQKHSLLELLQSVLAASASPHVAESFARAIAVTVPADQPNAELFVAAIVELLKWPTTAEPGATEALLDVLRDRVPGAPGEDANLDTMVAWVAATYPDIDLASPPTYPVSGNIGGSW